MKEDNSQSITGAQWKMGDLKKWTGKEKSTRIYDGWDVIFIAVDDVDYLKAGLLEGLFHGGADFGSFF